MRHPHDVELPVRVDRADPAPLPAQLVQQLRELVVSGALRPGDPLPSTRGLAARLGISRGSVVTAYDQLHGEGYLHATNGATVVHPDLAVETFVLSGRPADQLVEAGRSAELVVVGSRGYGGFRGLLMGSVSQAVLQDGEGPVMVVPNRKKD